MMEGCFDYFNIDNIVVGAVGGVEPGDRGDIFQNNALFARESRQPRGWWLWLWWW